MNKILGFIKLFFSLGFLLVAAGCATTYFPLKNETFFEDKTTHYYSMFVLPFQVRISTFYSPYNTAEKVDKASLAAQTYFYNALKEAFAEKGYNVTGYISQKNIDDEKVDKEIARIIYELVEEYNSAFYSFHHNLQDEKGKNFDYSLGLRVKELKDKFKENPDIFVLLVPSGFIQSFAMLENGAMKTLSAIFSLGLSLLAPAPDDVTCADIALIETKSGNIIWYDTECAYAHSVAIEAHVKDSIKKIIKDFPSRIPE